eukprot:972636-Ditylum_brightwellii.AAC.1
MTTCSTHVCSPACDGNALFGSTLLLHHHGTPPLANFSWENDNDSIHGGDERYRKFFTRTKERGEAVELVDVVSHSGVQWISFNF